MLWILGAERVKGCRSTDRAGSRRDQVLLSLSQKQTQVLFSIKRTFGAWKNEGALPMKCGKPHENQSARTSCEYGEHFMTTKLSLYVCNANTSWIEIAITFSKKSRKKQRALRSAPPSSVAPYHSFPLLRENSFISYLVLSPKGKPFRNPRIGRLCFWPYASLVRVQHGAKIKNPVERRDFCFVLFNIYHSLNGVNFQWIAPFRYFFKIVVNKAQLNILMSRMWRLLGYVCL